jgi:hypothetical protein
MLNLLAFLIIMLLVATLALYIMRMLPLPEPFGVVLQALVALLILLALLDLIFGGRFLGIPHFR